VVPVLSFGQLLTAEVFSDLARQTLASADEWMGHDQALGAEPTDVSGQALEEFFAQLGVE
jgi:hypothetical protein